MELDESIIFFLIALCYSMASLDMSTALQVTVDQSGRGNYNTIQQAIDAVPSGNRKHVFISVKPGVYREKILVPADKPFLTLSGARGGQTIISWADGEDVIKSATFTVLASDFVGQHLTIQNTYGTRAQAVALRVSADRATFHGCRITSYQDTLLDEQGRHYYNNCYIEGGTDFICGNAASLFENCHLHSLSDWGGAITAQKRQSPGENTGFTFLGGKITGKRKALLGRPWGAYSRVVFAQTYMSSIVLPQGWNDWGDSANQRTVYYGEYNTQGPGAIASGRVPWARKLTREEAAPFMTEDIIGGREWIRPARPTFMSLSSNISINIDGKA